MVKVTDVANPIVINYSFGNVSFEELDEYAHPSIMIFIGESILDDVETLCEQYSYINIPKFKLTSF